MRYSSWKHRQYQLVQLYSGAGIGEYHRPEWYCSSLRGVTLCMVAVAAVCIPTFFCGSVISRLAGAILLSCYISHTLVIILAEPHPRLSGQLSLVVAYAVIPLSRFMSFMGLVPSLRSRA